jgi:hypothetical protein
VARAFYGAALGLTDELDALGTRLGAAGFPVTWDDGLPGHRRFHTADGHGNRVELLAVGPLRAADPQA